jgi:DNA polymerase-3 subunit delta
VKKYYIDKLSDFIEEKFSEEEKGFNQTVLYGRDFIPMMAERQSCSQI